MRPGCLLGGRARVAYLRVVVAGVGGVGIGSMEAIRSEGWGVRGAECGVRGGEWVVRGEE